MRPFMCRFWQGYGAAMMYFIAFHFLGAGHKPLARRAVGVISQTDLLATLAKSLSQSAAGGLTMGGHGQGI